MAPPDDVQQVRQRRFLGRCGAGLTGDAANPGQALLALTTRDGALRLNGNGNWGPAGVRFRRAVEREEPRRVG